MENFVEKINFSVIGNWHFDLLFWPNMSASIPAVGVCHSSSCNRSNLLTFYPFLPILLPCQIFILHFARFVYFSCQISGTFCCFVWIFLNFVLAFHFYFSLYPLFYFSCPIQNLNTFPTSNSCQIKPSQTSLRGGMILFSFIRRQRPAHISKKQKACILHFKATDSAQSGSKSKDLWAWVL